MLPACQEPQATGLEVSAVAATGQGLPLCTVPTLSPPRPLTGIPRHAPPRRRALHLTRVLACLGTVRPGTCGCSLDTRPQLWGRR